jgi:hypothetical protein
MAAASAFELLPVIIIPKRSGRPFRFPSQNPLQAEYDSERGQRKLVH